MHFNSEARIVDITHQITPFNYNQAAYMFGAALKNFPPDTIHLLLVNLFEKKPEHLLLIQYSNQYILCADNGIYSMLFANPLENIVRIPLPTEELKTTIYLVKIMAQLVQKLSNGATLNEIGRPSPLILEKKPLLPLHGHNWIQGQVIFIDNFENLVINITSDQFEEQRRGRSYKIEIKRDIYIAQISESYADVSEGELLALFNSAGYLEIAINKGNAAGLLGFEQFTSRPLKEKNIVQNRLSYETVMVHFE